MSARVHRAPVELAIRNATIGRTSYVNKFPSRALNIYSKAVIGKVFCCIQEILRSHKVAL